MSDNRCTRREYALALEVALSNSDNWPTHTCVAWVDSADRTCGKPRTEGLLCKRHDNIAEKRHAASIAKDRAQREKWAAEREAELPGWRSELAKVEARMRVLDPPDANTDPAAYAGNVHPSIRRKRVAFMSDRRVMEMGKLVRRAEELRRRIGNDEQTAA